MHCTACHRKSLWVFAWRCLCQACTRGGPRNTRELASLGVVLNQCQMEGDGWTPQVCLPLRWDNSEGCFTEYLDGIVPTAQSANLLSIAPCAVFPPFPVSLPHSPTRAFWNHFPNKLIVLKSLSKSPFWGTPPETNRKNLVKDQMMKTKTQIWGYKTSSLGRCWLPSTEIKILQDREGQSQREQHEFGKTSFSCSRDVLSQNSWSTRLKLLTLEKVKINWTTQEEKPQEMMSHLSKGQLQYPPLTQENTKPWLSLPAGFYILVSHSWRDWLP